MDTIEQAPVLTGCEDIAAALRRRIEEAKLEYDYAVVRSEQLAALARLARLKAALAGLEAQ